MQNDTELNKVFASCLAGFKSEFPELEKRGAGSILSEYYGKADILFMGLNPGAGKDGDQRAIVEGPHYIDDAIHKPGGKYWQRAHMMQESLKPFFESAVFGNVFPVATKDQGGVEVKLQHHFTWLFNQIMVDVQPKVIIFAGQVAPRVVSRYVWHMCNDEDKRKTGGAYEQTEARDNLGILTWDGRAIPWGQITHFSARGWSNDGFAEEIAMLKELLDTHLKS